MTELLTPKRLWTVGAGFLGMVVLTKAAAPKGPARAFTDDESTRLVAWLAGYRAPMGTPLALQKKPILSAVAYEGRPDDASVGVKVASDQVLEAIRAGRFVFAAAEVALAQVPAELPSIVHLAYVLPSAVARQRDQNPTDVLIAAPEGYAIDGTRL